MKQKLIILLILFIALVGGADAYVSTPSLGLSSDIQYNGISGTIENTVPIFGALQNLIIAIVPYILTLILITGLMAVIIRLFGKGPKW